MQGVHGPPLWFTPSFATLVTNKPVKGSCSCLDKRSIVVVVAFVLTSCFSTTSQVNLKLFAPEPNRARTVLLFVIRDKSVTPIPVVANILMDDLKSVWDTMSKPEQYKGSSIIDFFDVQVGHLLHACRP